MNDAKKKKFNLVGADGQPINKEKKLTVPPEVEQQAQEELLMKVQAFLVNDAGQKLAQIMIAQMQVSQLLIRKLAELLPHEPAVQQAVMMTVYNQIMDEKGQPIPWSFGALKQKLEVLHMSDEIQLMVDTYAQQEAQLIAEAQAAQAAQAAQDAPPPPETTNETTAEPLVNETTPETLKFPGVSNGPSEPHLG